MEGELHFKIGENQKTAPIKIMPSTKCLVISTVVIM